MDRTLSGHRTARELFDMVCDRGTFRSWDDPVPAEAHATSYAASLDRARAKTGADESVLTGEGMVHGHRVGLMACEFGFLGGSIGRAAARRLVAAAERATAAGLPLLAGPASGGTRMQEGTPAFTAMVGISAAIARHKAAGLPYLVYLRHPVTGGVMSSWASLGHVTAAEPGAELMQLPSPTVSVILGEGTGGGALALLPADTVLCARHGWLAPLPPEGAAEILHRDTARAAQVSAGLGITATALHDAGIVDRIIPEFEDAADEPRAFCERAGHEVQLALAALRPVPTPQRLATRLTRYRPLRVRAFA